MDVFSYAQLQVAAQALGWQVEMIRALVAKEVTESPFFTFNKQSIPKILFERHKFWRHLIKQGIDPRELLRQDPSLSDILSDVPYKRYGKFTEQYRRRERAMMIHRASALSACSYTAFQILGENFEACGYATVDEFVQAMEDPANWLEAFVALVKHKGVEHTLRPDCLDFAAFSEAWNGSQYYVKQYDVELARLYQRELAASLPKHESMISAVVQSGTVQRGAAIVATGATPVVGGVLGSDTVGQIVEAVKGLTERTAEVTDQVKSLQAQADTLAPYLEWLPWISGGWTALLLLCFVALVHRYLRYRGYLSRS
jgi:hypothetical protein